MNDDNGTAFPVFLTVVGGIALFVAALWLGLSLVLGGVGAISGPNTKARDIEFFLECRGREKTPDILPDVVGGVDMKFCAQASEK